MELSGRIEPWSVARPRSRFLGLSIAAALHVIVVLALFHYAPVRSAFSEAVPIMVSLIAPPPPVIEKPKEPPKPLPVKKHVERQPEPQHIITSTAEVPAPVAPMPPPPAPVVAAAPPAAPSPPAPAPAPQVVPPSFHADYLDNPPPAYPPLSRRMGEQGKVMLRVLVNPKGTADKVELRSSSGSARLDDAALDVVKRWRFVPAKQGDQPVPAWVLIPITFSLKG